MLELGIDDAGRGPVIGPMVLAGCLINEDAKATLRQLGVKDSKQLTPRRREFLAEKIKAESEAFEIIVIPPIEIDSTDRGRIKLNEVEAIACAEIINKINKGNNKIKTILDCPSTSLVRWGDFLKTQINNLANLEISCEHKADRNHISVSAASIIAKSAREFEMDKLKKIYGEEIGSGYTSDPLTQKFLAKYAHKYKNEGIFRQTWTTWKTANNQIGQRRLF